jgi:predicted ATPase
LVYVRGIAAEATYQFKHALVRDADYEALLKSRRRELHRLVARQFPAITWFTEGFDTAGLKEAKALLDELID